MDLDKWCATYKTFYYYVFEQGTNSKCFGLGALNPWQDKSFLIQARNWWFGFYMIFCVFNVAAEHFSESEAIFLFISGMIQILYVVVKFIAEMRPWQWWHFLNPYGNEGAANLSNLALALCLWLEFLNRCNEESSDGSSGCFSKALQRNAGIATITFTALGKCFQVMNFICETKSVETLFGAVVRTLPTLGPHFGLFLAVYYGFSGMGIAFFCGMCKQSVLEGGPGYWGQDNTVTALAGNNRPTTGPLSVMGRAQGGEGAPWDQTM